MATATTRQRRRNGRAQNCIDVSADGPSLGRWALKLSDTDVEERGPLVEEINEFFGAEILDANGVLRVMQKKDFQHVSRIGRVRQLRWARYNLFVWATRAVQLLGEAEREIQKAKRRLDEDLQAIEERTALLERERRLVKTV